MVGALIFRSSCKINGWCILVTSGSIWRYLALHPQGAKSPMITCAQGWNEQVVSGGCLHINNRVWGNKKWELSLHILKEELVVGGGNIGHHVAQIESGVTNNQNTIRILMIFWAVRERQIFDVYSSVISTVPWISPIFDPFWFLQSSSGSCRMLRI